MRAVLSVVYGLGVTKAALWSVIGFHIADFPLCSRETSGPRVQSVLLALARQRGVLVQSSGNVELSPPHPPLRLGSGLASGWKPAERSASKMCRKRETNQQSA